MSAARRLCKALFRSSRRIHLALYWLTATNAVMAVLVNDYRIPLAAHSPEAAGLLGNIYSRVFFFARLRPRLMSVPGAWRRRVTVGVRSGGVTLVGELRELLYSAPYHLSAATIPILLVGTIRTARKLLGSGVQERNRR